MITVKFRVLQGLLGIVAGLIFSYTLDVNAKSENCCLRVSTDTLIQEMKSSQVLSTKPIIIALSTPKVKFLGSLDELDGRIFVSLNGKFLATLGSKLAIYNLQANQLVGRLPDSGDLSNVGSISAVAMSPNWTTMAIGSVNSQLLIRNVQNGQVLQQLPISGVQNERAMTYNKSSNILFVGSRGNIEVVDVAAEKVLGSIKYGKSEVKEIVLDTIQNRFLAVSYLWDGVIVWDILNGKGLNEPALKVPLPDAASGASSIAISPDGKFLAIGFSYETIRVYSIQSGRMIYELPPPSGKSGLRGDYSSVKALKFSPDSRYLASGYYAAGFTVWDMKTGGLLQRIKIGQGMGIASESVNQIEFSPNGNFLFTDGNFKINVWKFQD